MRNKGLSTVSNSATPAPCTVSPSRFGYATGLSCRECGHWQSRGYWRATGRLKPARCGKAAALMHSQSLPEVPHYAAACKYFFAIPNPPGEQPA